MLTRGQAPRIGPRMPSPCEAGTLHAHSHRLKPKQKHVWSPYVKPKPLTVGSDQSRATIQHPHYVGSLEPSLREDTHPRAHPTQPSLQGAEAGLSWAPFSKTVCSLQSRAGLGSWLSPLNEPRAPASWPGMRWARPAWLGTRRMGILLLWVEETMARQPPPGHPLGTCSLWGLG